MLVKTEGGEQVKVLDFGIAKWAQKNSGQTGNIKTRTGVMIGTPTYMAPEQCGGDGEVCDRTDVYALGVMLFEELGCVGELRGPFPLPRQRRGMVLPGGKWEWECGKECEKEPEKECGRESGRTGRSADQLA
jgi:serine/threonine protein kinase